MDDVDRMASVIHASLAERKDVLAEKVRLFPAGCKALFLADRICGYGIAHPWTLFDVPRLDAFLWRIPDDADCIHIHDVAILPEGRGSGASGRYVEIIRAAAIASGIRKLACVSVYGTQTLWARHGFREETSAAVSARLRAYGPTARYMVADV